MPPQDLRREPESFAIGPRIASRGPEALSGPVYPGDRCSLTSGRSRASAQVMRASDGGGVHASRQQVPPRPGSGRLGQCCPESAGRFECARCRRRLSARTLQTAPGRANAETPAAPAAPVAGGGGAVAAGRPLLGRGLCAGSAPDSVAHAPGCAGCAPQSSITAPVRARPTRGVSTRCSRSCGGGPRSGRSWRRRGVRRRSDPSRTAWMLRCWPPGRRYCRWFRRRGSP